MNALAVRRRPQSRPPSRSPSPPPHSNPPVARDEVMRIIWHYREKLFRGDHPENILAFANDLTALVEGWPCVSR